MHLSEELLKSKRSVSVETKFGQIRGRRALNGCSAFLEVPYAQPPKRFSDPEPLPADYRYPDIEFIHESLYGVQPDNDGQSAGTLPRDKLGLGGPTEDPLFLNIVCPPDHPSGQTYPVKVYIHGGFLQFGSPHGLSSQAQYVSAERNEIWVNIGYRLSVFGFLANDKPYLSGNYGFKDQWLALLWIKQNIASFGGDPDNIILTGLSAGAHSVHQILLHVSHLSGGEMSPFSGVIMQSNAIVNDPKSPSELNKQYIALLEALNLDPASEESLQTLRNPEKISWESITAVVEKLDQYGTFRACTDGEFIRKNTMKYQASPEFAANLKSKGVEFLIVGELKDEWYLYAIANPITDYASVGVNLRRCYPDEIVERMLEHYSTELRKDTSQEECFRMYGVMFSDGQVHLPIRLLHQDLARNGFPVLRYQINWTPEQCRPLGYVTHATDRVLWTLRADTLTGDQADTARQWLNTIDKEIKNLKDKEVYQSEDSIKRILTLREDRSIGWEDDLRWDTMMNLAANVFPV